MKKIAFFNRKGGVGKTTSTVNIAASLNNLGYKVLVVDCDSQKNTTEYLGAYSEYSYTIEDYLNNNIPIENIITKINLRTSLTKNSEIVSSNISLVPASEELETLSIDNNFSPKVKIENVFTLKNMLDSVEDEYDFCLFDLPPQLTRICICALIASDYIIVLARADVDSLGGYDKLIDIVNEIRYKEFNLNLHILGVVYNSVKSNWSTQKYIFESSKNNMEELMFDNYIKETSAIEKARMFSVPVPSVNIDKKISEQYINLTNEILERIREMEKRNG